jgi:hypothetical protein
MKNEHYPFISDAENCIFVFKSIGPKGNIEKIIEFEEVQEGLWNLAFGDKTAVGWTDEFLENNLILSKN